MTSCTAMSGLPFNVRLGSFFECFIFLGHSGKFVGIPFTALHQANSRRDCTRS